MQGVSSQLMWVLNCNRTCERQMGHSRLSGLLESSDLTQLLRASEKAQLQIDSTLAHQSLRQPEARCDAMFESSCEL